MHIVQLANFITPTSGGLRTALDELGREYVARGHRVTRIVPAAHDTGAEVPPDTSGVHTIGVASPLLAGTGGYRIIRRRAAVADMLAELAPDAIELSDKTTLVAPTEPLRRDGVRVVLLSHERIDAILRPRLVSRWLGEDRLVHLADRHNRSLVARCDAVVTASAFAAEEFLRIGAPTIHRVRFGVDLVEFHPAHRDPNSGPAGPAVAVCTGRLSAEKRPDLAIDTVRELHRRGVEVQLLMIGDGPERRRLERQAAGLPVRFLGHIADRRALALILRHADVGIAPCPCETFGLAALETLASGTPVVAPDEGALAELLSPPSGTGRPGLAAPDGALGLADAIEVLLGPGRTEHRRAARRRAEEHTWAGAAAAMEQVLRSSGSLVSAAHGSNDSPRVAPVRPTLCG